MQYNNFFEKPQIKIKPSTKEITTGFVLKRVITKVCKISKIKVLNGRDDWVMS